MGKLQAEKCVGMMKCNGFEAEIDFYLLSYIDRKKPM